MIETPLFDYPMHPGWKGTATSEDAADAIAPKAETLRNKCYRMLALKPMTADECADTLGESVLAIRPRLSELVKLGKIKDSGDRRKNKSGIRAIVWEVCS